MKGWLQRLWACLISLKVTTAGLAVLMLLVVGGTLYQAEYGLYAAQQTFL